MIFNFDVSYNTEIQFDQFKGSKAGEFIIADGYFEGRYDSDLTYYTPQGERAKNFTELGKILAFLEERKIRKCDKIIAIGGGAVLDLAGAVASMIHRGIQLLYIPTTLLAMVDACLGGKTGINTDLGKNTFGTVYPAHEIIIDESFLETLPKREYNAAMAEVIKYELISGESLVKLPRIAMIERCLQIKAGFCTDLLDKSKRKFLNYGHTLGHALETLMPLQLLHGEAVAIGMVFAAKLTVTVSLLEKTLQLLYIHDLPTEIPNVNMQEILQQMKLDKKNKSDKVSFVILDEIGRPKLKEFNDNEILNIS